MRPGIQKADFELSQYHRGKVGRREQEVILAVIICIGEEGLLRQGMCIPNSVHVRPKRFFSKDLSDLDWSERIEP